MATVSAFEVISDNFHMVGVYANGN